jgi:hypothetical protein
LGPPQTNLAATIKGSLVGSAFPLHCHDRFSSATSEIERVSKLELAAIAVEAQPRCYLGTEFKRMRCVWPRGNISCQQSCAGGDGSWAISRQSHQAVAGPPIAVGRASSRVISGENLSYSLKIAPASCSHFGRDLLGADS